MATAISRADSAGSTLTGLFNGNDMFTQLS